MNLNINIGASTRNAINSLNNLTRAIQQSGGGLNNITRDANRASGGFNNLAGSSRMLGRAVGMIGMYGLANGISKALNSAMDMIETVNLFEVSLGDLAETTDTTVQSMSKLTGLDPTNLQNSVGTFALLAKSMGMSGEQAQVLSTNTAQLGLDLSSLTNIPINQVMGDLRSGLVGQSETMYKYGVDITEAGLKTEALRQGITGSVRDMSQGEKMALRYAVMIRQTALAHGDLARTINSPANQLRMLQERFITLGRSIGTIFIPALTVILPYANAIVMILTKVANAIAKFFGYKPTKVKNLSMSLGKVNNSYNDVGTSATKAGKKIGKSAKDMDKAQKSAKKLQSTLMGFDQINLLKLPTADDKTGAGGSGGAGGVGGGDVGGGGLGGLGVLDGFKMPSYDALFGDIKSKADDLVKELTPKMKALAILVGLVGLAFLSWKLAGLLGTGGKFASLLIDISATLSMMKGLNIKEIGSALKTLFPKFTMATGIFLILGGLILLITNLYKIITKSKPAFKDFALAMAGVAMIAGGMAMIFTPFVGGVVLAIGAVVLLGLAIYKYWDEILAFTKKTWGKITKFFDKTGKDLTKWGKKTGSDISKGWNDGWKAIGEFGKKVWNGLVDFYVKTWKLIINKAIEIFTPIVEFYVGIWTKIFEGVTIAWGAISQFFLDTFTKIGDAFSTGWQNISDFVTKTIPGIVDNIVEWFKELPGKIGTAISTVATNIGTWASGVKSAFGTKIGEIITAVVQWFDDLPGKIGGAIGGMWNTIATWRTTVNDCFNYLIPTILNNVVNWFKQVPGKVGGAIGAMWNTIAGWRDNVKSYFYNAVVNINSSVASYFAGLPGRIYNTIKGCYNTITSIGSYLLSGIFTGLGKIGAKITNWKNSLIGAIKKAFGIHSPSRVMKKEVGHHLGTGIFGGLMGTLGMIVGSARKISKGIKGEFEDISVTPSVDYRVADLGTPQFLSGAGAFGTVSATQVFDTGNITSGVYKAVVDGVTDAMGKSQQGDVVLQVGATEFGRIAINSINNVTKQTGRLAINI